MKNPENFGPGAPISEISTTGEFSNIPGLLAHYEVSVSLCQFLVNETKSSSATTRLCPNHSRH